MFAAPTAEEDFELLIVFQSKPWKDKFTFLDSLMEELQNTQSPQKIQICFLQMLNDKNVNVIIKVIKLVRKYIQLYGINNLSLKEFTQSILNFSLVPYVPVEEVIIELFRSVKVQSNRKQIFQALETFAEGNREKNNLLVLKIYVSLLPHYSLKQLCYFQHLLECLTHSTLNLNESIENVLYEFFKILAQSIGFSVILLARKVGYPYVHKLLQEIKLQSNMENIEGNRLNFTYKLGSNIWFQDYKLIPIKSINNSLKSLEKQLVEDLVTLTLTSDLIQSLIYLARRKNNTINKSIYQITTELLSREFTISNPESLFDLLFELFSNRRIVKRMQEENKTRKEEMWLQTITEENLQRKVTESSVQDEYHRLILLIQMSKKQHSLSMKLLKQKHNLSHVYKVQLDHLIKEQTQS